MHEPALHVRGGTILVDLALKLKGEDSGYCGEFHIYADLPCTPGEDTRRERDGARLRQEVGRQDLLDQNTQLMLQSLRNTGSARMPTDVFDCLQGESAVSLAAKCSLDSTKVDKDLIVEEKLEEKKASGSKMVGSPMKENFIEVRKHQNASGLPLDESSIQDSQCISSQKLERIQTRKRACRKVSDTQVDNRNIQISSSSKRKKWTKLARGGNTKHTCDHSAPRIKNLQSFPKQNILDKKVRTSKGSIWGDGQTVGSRDAVTKLKSRVREGVPPKLELAGEVISSECCKGNRAAKYICEPRKILSPLSGNSAGKIDEDISREEEAAEFEQCVSLLTKYGVLKARDYYRSRNLPSNVPHPGFVGDGHMSKTCKICGVLEDGKGTVICDECQETFHMSCCIPRITSKYFEKEDHWYCSTCRKQKKSISKFSSEVLPCKSEVSQNGTSVSFGSLPLAGSRYVSRVRLGPAHQVDVPSWTGRVEEKLDTGRFGTEAPICEQEKVAEEERIRKEHEDNIRSLGWLRAELLPQGSLENWLQCYCIVKRGRKDPDGQKATEDIICGKWRRAPLGVEQKENWECFCTILWDPFHADCAVPQELTTEEIMRRMQWQLTSVCNDEAKKTCYMRET